MTFRPMSTDYAPYHTLPAFDEGIEAYMSGRFENPYRGVAAQAWDRGSEYAMRVVRHEPWVRGWGDSDAIGSN
jgi:hypothetical protein